MNLEENLPRSGFAYTHYRGESYVVQGFAIDTATEAVVVVYRPLEGDREQCFTRPLTGPGGWLTPVLVNGKRVPRFAPREPVELRTYVLVNGFELRQQRDESDDHFRVRVQSLGGTPTW